MALDLAPWGAQWVSHANDPREDLGIFVLRNRLVLAKVPERLEVRVSADQRYKLFVGDRLVCFGPQRGDLAHWHYETVDLAPFLQPGENLIWALVWNFGWSAPMAQISLRTGFVFDVLPEAHATEEGQYQASSYASLLNTPGPWQIARATSWDFRMMHKQGGNFYIEVGPGEIWDGRQVSDWKKLPESELLAWKTPYDFREARPRGAVFEPFWSLVPAALPLMRYEQTGTRPCVRHGFVDDPRPDSEDNLPLTSGAKLDGPLLLDYKELLCAYPQLVLSGPAGTEVVLTYAESLWVVGDPGAKENRNAVAGKEMRGYQDKIVLSDGPTSFEPLWWRTFRYLMLESSGPVALDQIDVVETGYPLEVESSFEADDACVKPIWDVSIRTVERCLGETYFDCPYYEQLQYVGDTRIQAMIGYYLGRDRRPQRNSIDQFGCSLMSEMLTQSRYPNRIMQIIPPFSLWYIAMLADQRFYDRVEQPEAMGASRVHEILLAVSKLRIEPQRAFWNFVDWVPTWVHGVPAGEVYSTEISLIELFCEAFDEASPRYAITLGDADNRVVHNRLDSEFEKVDGLVKHLDDEDWKPSEHTEAMYRLVQTVLGFEPDPWPHDALERAGAAKASLYFAYYKHLAMRPDDYLALLGPWKEMIEAGLSTFAEKEDPTRSDCHAWSAHPILGFFQIVAGVTSNGAGWTRARIEPRPGSLRRFDARIAHPDGQLRVAYEDGRLTIDTPVKADLIWQGKRGALARGLSVI